MNVGYFLLRLWEWLIAHGLPIAALIVIALLIPRIGRFAVRVVTQRLTEDEEATKTRLALVGALVYVVEAVAYFFVVMLILTNLGVPPMGAALPATVVSAAVGFGAQNVIGDFLAGFFIISERQFGLGDYVSFDGPNNPVEGTVVALTLRATRLRTPAGEMVNVPNGSTGVITNFSQEWSRAVVDIQIPMESGESMTVLTRKVEHAARKAVSRPDIAEQVTNDLDVLPATQLIQPSAAGQPWSIQYRITVDVNPAQQWTVERAIRSAVANVFWERMQHNRGLSAIDLDATEPNSQPRENQKEAALTTSAPAPSRKESTEANAPTEVFPSTNAADEGDASPNDELRAADDGPGAPALKESGPAATTGESNRKDPFGADGSGHEEGTGSEAWFQRHEYDTKLKNFLSIGGRTRVSTTVLFLVLLILGGLALASSNPEGGNAGLLNPARWQSTEEKTTDKATPTEATTTTDNVAPTTETAPTDTTQTDTTQPTGEQQRSQNQSPRQSQESTTSTSQRNSESTAPTQGNQQSPVPSDAEEAPSSGASNQNAG